MDFKGFSLRKELVRAVGELGFEEATPIQEQCIPEILKGKDVIGQSSTGSGKTAAFGLPILEKIVPRTGIQALILTPTRELCVQVSDSMKSFAKYIDAKVVSVYGGVNIEPQRKAIQTADIVVGTPGRILDHLRSGSISFNDVKFFVLDETDRMCDMGFYDDVEKIISRVPKKRQNLLFSATMTRDVDKLVHAHLHSPVTIKSSVYVDPSLLTQWYYEVSDSDKFGLLAHFLRGHSKGLSLVFCGTRREVDVVVRNLELCGIEAMAIHGGMPQNRRMRSLEALKAKHINVLVATDVAARGLDIPGVTHVYNYDVPKSPEEHIHRIGRTARAGAEGLAITLLSPRDHYNMRSVMRNSSLNLKAGERPVFEHIEMQRRVGGKRFGGRGAQHPGHGHAGQRRGLRGSGPRAGAHHRPDYGRGGHSRPRWESGWGGRGGHGSYGSPHGSGGGQVSGYNQSDGPSGRAVSSEGGYRPHSRAGWGDKGQSRDRHAGGHSGSHSRGTGRGKRPREWLAGRSRGKDPEF